MTGFDSSTNTSEEMIAELYGELRRLAMARVRKLAPGQTLQATALVHEAYLRLAREPAQRWDNRAHFFASAAEAMRRVLIDQIRRKAAVRRSGKNACIPLEGLELHAPEPDDRLLEVHETLDALETQHPLQAQIVKLRFFVGLNHDEVAELLGLSEKTVRRQWNFAKVWLYQQITNRERINS